MTIRSAAVHLVSPLKTCLRTGMVGATLALVACSSPEAAAEKVAKQWLDALNKNNLTEAQNISTDSTKGLLTMSASMGKGDMGVGKYKITRVTQVNENSVQVTVDAEDDEKDMTLDVVRIDGTWKVGVNK